MIKVNLMGLIPITYNHVIEMPAVPRIGDYISINPDDASYRVENVIWTPGHKGYDVQVRFR